MVGELVDAKEIARRESFIRAYNRPYKLLDPFTWPYPEKSAACIGGLSLITLHLNNLWYKKPFYYGMTSLHIIECFVSSSTISCDFSHANILFSLFDHL